MNKSFRFDRNVPREQAEPVLTVASDARTPQASKRKYRYVEYTIQHVDVDEMDCPKPGEKKVMPRAVRENIRKNRKKVRYHYEIANADSLDLLPAHYPR